MNVFKLNLCFSLSFLFLLIFSSSTYANTLEIAVNNDNDDVEERASNGSMYLDSSDLEMVYDGHNQIIGIRFSNITIPAGSTISNAFITFDADGTESQSTSLTIYAHNAGNSVAFSNSNHNVSSRARTSGVSWSSIPTWHDNSLYNTPNLSSIVQTIINRADWSSGNALSFIITGNGLRRAESHDGHSSRAPKLFIEYSSTSPGCGGCNCSLDTSANDSSPGVTIPGLNGATADVSKCISGSSENDDTDYYNFTVQTNGTLDVTTSSPNGHNYHMKVVSNMQGTLLSYDTNQNRTLSYALSSGEQITVQFKETGNDLDEYQANFTFTKSNSNCNGCNCSLDTSANDSSPGVTIPGLDGATANVSKCISGSSENDDTDYYNFTVQTNGTLDVTTSSPNGHNYHMEIVSSTQGDLLSYDSDKNRNLSYSVSTGEQITVQFKETGNNIDEYQADFTFTKNNNNNGCNSSLDTSTNDSSPGNLISDLDQVDSNVSTCFSGDSENDDQDYYNFTTASGGILQVQTSSPNGHQYHMQIESNKQGTLLGYDTNEDRNLQYVLSPNERVTFLFKETGSDKDEYQANVTFNTSEYIENAGDICYLGDPETTGLCTGFIGVNCTKTITLKSLNDIDNIQTIIDASSMMSGSLFSDCGVDGISGKNKAIDADGACSANNNIDMGPIGIFNKGVQYNLTSHMPADANHSIYNNALFDISFFKTENLYATYVKNGQKYRGDINKCTDGYCANLSKGDRDFTIRNPKNTRNVYGDYTIIGNQNLCTDHDGDGSCVGDSKTTSNSYPSLYVDIDGDSTTVNSSSSTLTIPPGAKVVWAGLYWQGTIHNSNNDNNSNDEDFGRDDLWTLGNKIVNATNVDGSHKQIDLLANNNDHGAYNACKIELKTPGNAYIDISADQLDFYKLGYGAFADITDKLNATNPNGSYTVADIKSQTGKETSHGNYAAWSLVVIYEKDNDKFRNISIFDGFVTVTSNYNGQLQMDGFLTKKTPPVKSKLAFFTLDGDGGTNSISIDNQKISNANHPENRFFNSTINSSISRDPSYVSARVDLDYIELTDILQPSQTSAIIRPRSNGDRYTASYFIMSAELRTIDMCFDYTYGQSGQFLTAKDTEHPRIDDSFLANTPIDVKLYFQNRENSDITIQNLKINIDPIDTTQTTYKRNSTYVTVPGGNREFLNDTGRSIADEHDNNITIGDVGSLDYFYSYYSLNHPSKNDINTSINAKLIFDLVISVNGVDVDLGENSINIRDMDPCQTSSSYEPVPGLFNIVHDGQTKASNPYYYYNIPTQVVKRSGNFHVQSMDPDDLNSSKAGKLTAVAVEMMDIAGFHYATATCTDSNATILSKKRVWAIFDDNTSSITPLDKTQITNAEFFDNAIKNAAFRLSYNAADANGSIIALSEVSSGKYKLTNFPSYGGQSCSAEFATIHSGATVNHWCGSNGGGNGTGMTSNELAACMECIYGFDTKMMCSRDNFSIRPEAFLLKINDLNQTNSNRFRLADQVSGVSTPVYEEVNLAADYNYSIEINATNHLNNEASTGYSKSFTTVVNAPDEIKYKWDPRGSIVTGCNETADKPYAFNFVDGEVDTNISIAQVGKYKLQIVDTTWTAVDHDVAYTAHHTAPYFKTSTDCITNDSSTQSTTSTSLNGCNISSQHINNDALNSSGSTITLKYNDYNVFIHPYRFDLSGITPSHGLNNDALGVNSFIYMADISQDENMSFHLNGDIVAQGYGGAQLSNFVTSCYAEPLNLDLNGTDDTPAVTLTYQYILNGGVVQDVNLSDTILLQDGNFTTANSGTATTVLNFNFNREINTSVNPKSLTFTNYSVDCTTPANCSFYADTSGAAVNLKTTHGKVTINNKLIHYYGRSHTTRQKFATPKGTSASPGKAFIYYEVYCQGATCQRTLLQDSTNSKISDDPRWFINTHHTSAYGSANTTTQKGATVVTGTNPTGNAPDFTDLVYTGAKGYPYTTTMFNTPSSWLIYNRFNPAATTNEFQVQFINGNPNWSGAHETDTTSVDGGTSTTNRRVMW